MKRFIPTPSELIPPPDDHDQSTWVDTVALTIAVLSMVIFLTAFLFGRAFLGLSLKTTGNIMVTTMVTFFIGIVYLSRDVFSWP
jgi:hypothetical protein